MVIGLFLEAQWSLTVGAGRRGNDHPYSSLLTDVAGVAWPRLDWNLTPTPPAWQVSLKPVDTGSGSRLREGVQALAPSVASLALLPDLRAEREGGEAGGAWRLELLDNQLLRVPVALELCAVFDRPGRPSGLTGQVGLTCEPPEEAAPAALGTYLGRCAELASRLRGGGDVGLELTLDVNFTAAGAEEGGGGGGFLGRVLGAMLPGAAPHVRNLQLWLKCAYPAGWSRHLTEPGLAFPLLEGLGLEGMGLARTASMAAADVVALARLAAPRLRSIGLLSPPWYPGDEAMPRGSILGQAGTPCAELAVTALALTRPRPVDAAGRPAILEIYAWCRPDASSERNVSGVLEAAGRGGTGWGAEWQGWVRVFWPYYEDSEEGTEGLDDGDG